MFSASKRPGLHSPRLLLHIAEVEAGTRDARGVRPGGLATLTTRFYIRTMQPSLTSVTGRAGYPALSATSPANLPPP